MPRSVHKKTPKEFSFLIDKAISLGAIQAEIVSPAKVAVENRVLLKCRTGCQSYGNKLTCPPFAPSPDEFRRILKEYRHILIVKFGGKADADKTVGRSLLKNQYSAEVPPEIRQRTKAFWDEWGGDKKRFLHAMLELEKTAFNAGYTLALTTAIGSCALCEKCNVGGSCLHPTMARYPEHAMGVNVKKTLANIGWTVNFPFEGHPEGIGMVLID